MPGAGGSSTLLPAHPPSRADPLAAVVGAVFTLAVVLGLPLSEYMTTEEAVAAGGAVVTLAATCRALWQRIVAARSR